MAQRLSEIEEPIRLSEIPEAIRLSDIPEGTRLSDVEKPGILQRAAGNYVGAFEGGAQLLSGMAAAPVSGIAGLVMSPFGRGVETVRKVGEALTYQPRTEEGRRSAEILQFPFEKLQEGIGLAGEKTFEKTGSPVAATGVEVGLNAALLALPLGLGRRKAKATEKPAAKPEIEPSSTPVVEPAPTGIAVKDTSGKTIQVETIGDLAEPLFTSQVAPNVTKGIASLAKDFFEKNPGLRDPTRLISDDIQRYVAGGAIPKEVLATHGLTEVELASIWRESITEHARALGQLSQVWRQARETLTPEEWARLQAAGVIPEDAVLVRPFWKKITDTWRALLVTQPATAVRNAITQTGRVGLDVIQAPIDNWLQRLTGREVTVQPLDGFNEVVSLLQRNKANTDQILQAFPNERQRLFQRYLSDIERQTGQTLEGPVWEGIQTGVDAVNVLNRTQEFVIRRGIFQAALDVELRNRGLNLHDIIQNNRTGRIPDEAVAAAVDTALTKTFAETPKGGTWQRALIDAVNKLPGASIAIPFPRFMYNALKFQYEFSPMGVLSYLSKAEREAFAKGDVSVISKATIGAGLLGAAFLFRDSEYAGEKWYEAVDPETGNIHDLRPFNPFVSYLFVADVLKKQKEGTLYKLTGNDIAQGLLSTNMRAGTGLYLLDNALNLMSQTADEKKLATKGAELSGDFLSGFLTPLSTFRDAYDQITEGVSITRDTRQEFLGPLKSRIPGVSQTLPEAEIPTRAGPIVTIDPALRQITGVTTHGPKNPVEKELERLGFDRRAVLATTGDREVDRKYAEMMGIAVEGALSPVVETAGYKRLPDAMRGVVLHESLTEIRNAVRETVNKSLPPEKQMEMEIRKLSPRIRLLLKDLGVPMRPGQE